MAVRFPQARTCPYHPSPGYEPLRHGPALHRVTLFDGRPSWLVTGRAQAVALLTDPRLSADRRRPGFPLIMPLARSVIAKHPTFVSLDEPEHGRHKRMLISEFTNKRFRQLRPEIERIVHDTLDAMLAAGPPAD